MRLNLHPDAKAALRQLRDDTERGELYSAIVRTIGMIRDEPGSADARKRAAATEEWGQVWVVPVRGHDDDWMIVWTPEEPDLVTVLYVGEAI